MVRNLVCELNKIMDYQSMLLKLTMQDEVYIHICINSCQRHRCLAVKIILTNLNNKNKFRERVISIFNNYND